MLRSNTHRGRRRSGSPARRLSPVAVAVAAVLLAGPAVVPASAQAASRSDARDAAGPLDLASVGVGQKVWQLRLRVRTYGRWDAADLNDRPKRTAERPQSYLCVDLRQSKRLRRVCIGRRQGESAHLTAMNVGERGGIGSAQVLKRARVERGSSRSLRARVPFRALDLTPGRVQWRWRSSWGEGVCAPQDAAERRRASRRNAQSCVDRTPDEGFATIRLRQPRKVGCSRAPRRIYRYGSRASRRVALTFDDGPSSYTSGVLRALDRYNAKATFYVLGQEVSGRRSLLRTMLRTGHEIGNHSTHHRSGPSRSDLAQTNSIVRAATGFTPCTFRPPYGVAPAETVNGAWSLGMSTILWDVDTNDWRRPGSGSIYSSAVNGTRPGSIVLMHDGGGNRSQTVAATSRILRTLKSRGYRFVTVTELLRQRWRWR
jgi:peptidoglycan/xylan/chitin deacetylase (PgdA/CDA1 family)